MGLFLQYQRIRLQHITSQVASGRKQLLLLH